MKIPMMPKGVEHKEVVQHRRRARIRANRAVKIPMMPKGVEHRTGNRFTLAAIFLQVKIPMMPKGVEHRFMRSRYLKAML